MRWPRRHRAASRDTESKELAKRQLEIATAIYDESENAAHEHRFLLYTNHFGPNARIALQENRK